MDLDNPAADVPGLGIPGDVIADFEGFSHRFLPNAQWRKPGRTRRAYSHGHANRMGKHPA
jgi:hypothetical protein